jgi:hypothetical protein
MTHETKMILKLKAGNKRKQISSITGSCHLELNKGEGSS